MDQALGWLGRLFDSLMTVIPKIVLVNPIEGAVLFRNSRYIVNITHDNGIFVPVFFLAHGWMPCVRLERSGVHIYWPLVSEVLDVIPVRRQTVALGDQWLTTKDRKTLGVRTIIAYEISDAVLVLTTTWGYENVLEDYAKMAVKTVLVQLDFATIMDKSLEADRELTKLIKKELKPFGIGVLAVRLESLVECQVFGVQGIRHPSEMKA